MLPNALQVGYQIVLAVDRALARHGTQHISGKKAGKHPQTGRYQSRGKRPPRSG